MDITITNTTKGDLGLDPNTVVPAGGTLTISDKYAAKFEGSKIVNSWFKSGALTVSEGDDVEDEAKAATAKKKSKKRLGLEANAEKAGIAFTDDMSDDDLAEAIKAAK